MNTDPTDQRRYSTLLDLAADGEGPGQCVDCGAIIPAHNNPPTCTNCRIAAGKVTAVPAIGRHCHCCDGYDGRGFVHVQGTVDDLAAWWRATTNVHRPVSFEDVHGRLVCEFEDGEAVERFLYDDAAVAAGQM